MPISIIDNFDVNAPKNIDARLGPYDTTANALASIDEVTQRYLGLTVLVTGSGTPTEYWFQDGVTDSDLVLKPIGSAVGFPYSGSDSLSNNPRQALITGSLYLSGSGHITASGDISASGNLFALASDGASISHVALYNTSSGQFFYTASNALSTQANTLQQVTDQGNTTTNDIIVTGSLYQSGSFAYFQPDEFTIDALGDSVFSVGQLGTQDIKLGISTTSTEVRGPLTASIISASGNLFASASDGTGISHVALYNTSSGQFFYTASNALSTQANTLQQVMDAGSTASVSTDIEIENGGGRLFFDGIDESISITSSGSAGIGAIRLNSWNGTGSPISASLGVVAGHIYFQGSNLGTPSAGNVLVATNAQGRVKWTGSSAVGTAGTLQEVLDAGSIGSASGDMLIKQDDRQIYFDQTDESMYLNSTGSTGLGGIFLTAKNTTINHSASIDLVEGTINFKGTDLGTPTPGDVLVARTVQGGIKWTGSSAVGASTGSFLTTASAEFSEITFTKGDASTFQVETTPRQVVENVKNLESGTLTKGTPVYASGSTGNAIHVYAASASLFSRMPAAYVLKQNLTSGQEGLAVLTGFSNNTDTTGFESGDVLYVAANGGYTNVKPTGSNLIQNLGKVIVGQNVNGSIVFSGAGRANDIPNITPGYFWVGNSDSVATATPTSSVISDPKYHVYETGSGTDSIKPSHGNGNISSGTRSTVAGGANNESTNNNTFVGGGEGNCALQNKTAVLGGENNRVCQQYSVGGGGFGNTINSEFSGIWSGCSNTTTGNSSVILGGRNNQTSGDCSTIGGGQLNCARQTHDFVGGGCNNKTVDTAGSFGNAIVGGRLNEILDAAGNETYLSFIGGGECNKIDAHQSSIVGGVDNHIDGQFLNPVYSFIGGGFNNYISSSASNIVGGTQNKIHVGATNSSIVGGVSNRISGSGAQLSNYSAILGGCGNILKHEKSFIIGANLTSTANCTTFMNNAVFEGNISASGYVSASNGFIGDGSQLTNLPAGATPTSQSIYYTADTPDQDIFNDGKIYIKLNDAATDDIQAQVLTNPSSGDVTFTWESAGASPTSGGTALNTGDPITTLNGNFGDYDKMSLTVYAPGDTSYPYYEFLFTKGAAGTNFATRYNKWDSLP